MSDLPPRDEVIEALRYAVAPAAAAAVGVYGLLALVLWRLTPHWRRAMPAASVLALAAAVAAGNHYRTAFPWWPDGRWWHWVGPVVALAFVAELVARVPGVSGEVGHFARGLAAGVVGVVILPAEWRDERPWLVVVFGVLVAAEWALLAAVGRRGGGRLVTFGMSAVATAVSVVLLHQKTLGFSDVATLLGVGLFWVGVMGVVTRTDTSPAAAVTVVPLAALLVLGQALIDTPIPVWVFWVAGLLPLVLAVRLAPRVGRRAGIVAVLLVLGLVAGMCVFVAMQAAPLRFGDDG